MTPPETTSVDELAQRISGVRDRVGMLGAYLDPDALAARQAELEEQMQQPGFWDDPQVASKSLRRARGASAIAAASTTSSSARSPISTT